METGFANHDASIIKEEVHRVMRSPRMEKHDIGDHVWLKSLLILQTYVLCG